MKRQKKEQLVAKWKSTIYDECNKNWERCLKMKKIDSEHLGH